MSDAGEIEVIGLAQREAWTKRVMPPVEQLRPDLWSIPVPIPNNPLRYTTVYCLLTDSGVYLVDAGWEDAEVWTALNDGLALAGAAVADIKGVLVTHQHYDHIGLAKRVKEASDAWVALHPADTAQIMSPQFRERELADRLFTAWLVSLGAGADEAWSLRPVLEDPEHDPRQNFVEPDVAVVDGQLLDIPGWALRAVHTPGHTAGHLCFHEEKTDLLFAGDHVLPRISPNVSATPDPGFDALGEFLASQDKIAGYDSADALPAHEWRFRGLKARAEQLKRHHQQRLDELLEIIRTMPGIAPWEMAAYVKWSRSWDQYEGFMRVSAVGETMAHLVQLMKRGLVYGTTDAVPKYFVV